MIKDIENQIINGSDISSSEAINLINNCSTEDLCAAADRIRQHFMGNKIDTCSIMNARSGRCSEDCKWCSQSAHHQTHVDVYPVGIKGRGAAPCA